MILDIRAAQDHGTVIVHECLLIGDMNTAYNENFIN